MKKYVLFSLLMSMIAVVAVAQESGRYRKDADHLEFTLVVDGQSAKLTGWKVELSFNKNAAGVYVAEGGSKLKSGKDRSFMLTGTSGVEESFSLYAPLTYTLPEGIKEHIVNGLVYFYMPKVSEPHVVGEYLYDGEGEPKALLKQDGSGYFRHPTEGAIEYWGLETNYKGEVQKSTGVTGNYVMNIAAKHTDGTYRRMQIIVFPGERKTALHKDWIYKW